MYCLSFDLEEHFQVPAFDSPMRRRHWERFESRVEQNTERILALLAEYRVRATFFVLGWVGERHGATVRRIAEEGHEIASHGYCNEMVTTQTPRQFREDVSKTKAILEDLIGKPVLGYRAPNLVFSDDTLWALPILVEEGYRYDSSVLPVGAAGNGSAKISHGVRQIVTASGPLWELSPRTVKIAWTCLPISGGICFRLWPYPVFRQTVGLSAQTAPIVLYFRVWELDPRQPRMNGHALARFKHYWNLDKVESRLRLLLQDFQFVSVSEAFSEVGECSHHPDLTIAPVP